MITVRAHLLTLTPRLALALTILSLCAIAGAAAQADPDRTVAGGGTMPPGWNARTDRGAPLGGVKFEIM
ncbi:MAG: hypothetical protein ACREMF_06680, partial [Gemmatimonadales bacterium]